MFDQKRISPLLDGFTMGNSMSTHDGVTCCPAIKENTEKKFIVKIVSVPAAQVQMDALLLAGAFKDPSGAMEYYKDVAEDVAREAELLQKLSRLEGFLPYDGWQIEPITKKRLGYEVYLLSSYKRSLEKHLRRNPVTQLEAVNLGLDICTALSVCRQAGALYVDLKPSNIFVSEHKEYRIGDLGFISLDALHYTTLPQKYQSPYTPPELEDPMAPLNTTADTYALGMILYQLYNDSQLPSREDVLNGSIPSPVNADYELAEIILKAVNPDPQQRWTDPAAMGQALVSYMQRNAVNDVPITPHTPLVSAPDQAAPMEETGCDTDQADTALPEGEESQDLSAPETESTSASENVEESPNIPQDDSIPDEADANLLMPHEMSEELTKIVAQADELIAHETLDGIPLPKAPVIPDPFAFIAEDSDEIDDSNVPVDPVMDDPQEATVAVNRKKQAKPFFTPERKRKFRRFMTSLLLIATMAAVCLCCWLYYQLFYLIPVNALTIDGTDQQLTVFLDTKAEESNLTVICFDDYGNVHKAGVSGGKAVFDNLLSNTKYTIQVDIEGFRKVSGSTTATFTTDANTKILNFGSVTGPEDGALVLYFTTEGEEPGKWTVVYSAEGEQEHTKTFTGHSVTIRELTIGKVYNFELKTEDHMTVNGETDLQVMASRVILARDILVTTTDGTDMSLSWKAPGDVVVRSWDVRCYNNSGFDTQFTVEDTTALIPNANPADGYTIEITAQGMAQPERISVTKEPLYINQFTLEDPQDSASDEMTLSWSFTGDKPKNGWLLMYTVDGSPTPNVIKCADASAVISPRIPGASYRFTLQTANSTSVLNNVFSYQTTDAAEFAQFNLTADMVTAKTLKTPNDKKWRYETIHPDDLISTFHAGDSISVVLQVNGNFYQPTSKVQLLYVYRDAYGNAIPALASQETMNWANIWNRGDFRTGELNIPHAPSSAGSYLLDICINGMILTQIPITVQ